MHKPSLFTDRDCLTSKAYADQGPLAIRVETHRRYTLPSVDWNRWVTDLIPWRGGERVLDVGCGSGQYIQPVVERVGEARQFLAGDLSLGMLRDLPDGPPAINLDVAALPLAEGACDVVLANHMLYHAPDIDRAVTECQRVLRGGGRLLAATNGQTTMTEMKVLIREGYERLGLPFNVTLDEIFLRFSLESGQACLERHFERVERHVLDSALVFPGPKPLLAYVDSLRDFYGAELREDGAWTDLLQVWREMIVDQIARHGEFRVNKVSGAFVAIKGPA